VFESETWELKLNIEGKDGKIKEILAACDALKQEKAKIMRQVETSNLLRKDCKT
jgi:hypothetical protein